MADSPSKSQSRTGSSGGSSSSRTLVGSVSSDNPQGYPPPLGYDPGRESTKIQGPVNSRLDLPPEAYAQVAGLTPFATRPGFNTTGKPINVQVNQFRVTSIGNADAYQFDVAISPEPLRSILFTKIWASKSVQSSLKGSPKAWLYDGRKLAWSTNKVKELRIKVNLDEEQGKTSSNDKNTFYVLIRSTGTIRLQLLRAYLEGKAGWSNGVLECMNFLDHVVRQGPSIRMHPIKRTFFPNDAKRQDLSRITEVVKGVYASIRMNQSIQQGGTGLGINVGVSNCTFWLPQSFAQLAREFIGCFEKKWENMSYDTMVDVLKPVVTRNASGEEVFSMSDAFKVLRKLQRLRFQVTHGTAGGVRELTIKSFVWARQYGRDGGHAKAVMFEKKDGDGKARMVSVYDHFLEQHSVQLTHWRLPVIETNRGGFFPMEVCGIPQFNRFPFKLNSSQTQKMIKFAVQRPTQGRQDIMACVKSLGWDKDETLDEFGIKVNPSMPMVQAKLIQNPEVQYSNTKVNPGTSGRWDLRGKKFISPNVQPLKSWAFVAVDACVDKPGLENFAKIFSQTYQNHGGRIDAKPLVYVTPKGKQHNELIEEAYKQTGSANKATPQIIFFVLKDHTAWVYERLKKNADCRWAYPTQMLQVDHVRRAQPQYCSNVSMKVNAKLGGQTSRIPGVGTASAFFKVPTMVIGVDVSHGAPGSASSSMAAMCASMDKDGAFFVGTCETNGSRVEILTDANIHAMLPDMVKMWCQKNKTVPQNLFYFRDGVSEGEFANVMQNEVKEIRKVFERVTQKVPKVTVIIATKRHHIRFFPEKGDKNGNPLPGTIVEREVTHPFHYDFYLCSHVAIQGTARPVHYHVIHDEIGWKPDDLQKMIYHQCYQYARSTTPVSLHPAVYYAHLASARARSHENTPTSDQVPEYAKHFVTGKGPGAMAKQAESVTTTGRSNVSETQPLLPMGGPDARPDATKTFRSTMWYI